jgi:pullulanase/glycogen debranching enzyme
VKPLGYNTLGFCAPHPAYAALSDPQDQLDEFKGMVKLLHAAGLEVILDVVYNHTCEQSGTEQRSPGGAGQPRLLPPGRTRA